MPTRSIQDTAPIYQLKITLREIRPPIWRRVLTPGAVSLHKVHKIIQIVMGWMDCHLHCFTVDGVTYSYPEPDSDWEDSGDLDSRRVKLMQIAPQARRKFLYEYDFGDTWEHDILVEKILPPEPGAKYPVCVAGKRACPPEDVGGVWGYAEFLKAIRDPEHREHASYLEWLGRPFDPEAFDLEGVNQLLRRIR